MSKKIKVNQNLCIGCAACANLFPNVFKMKEDNKAEVISSELCEGCEGCKARDQEIIDICPVRAIEIEG
jgi:ferredoxin